MANLTRRQWLKVGLAVGGMVTFGLSYRDVAKRAIDGLLNGTSGKVTRDRIFGNALIPEAQAQTHWQQNPQQTIAMTQCFGCWTQCGIRARVNADGKVIRIAGNPYHPLSQEHRLTRPSLLAKPWSNWREKAVLTPAQPPARAAPRCWKACTVRYDCLNR